MSHKRLTISLLALLAVCQARTQNSDPRGIYIYTNDLSQISKPTANALAAAFDVTGVDGVAVAIGWNAVEPTFGQNQWATLDRWIGQAVALGKKIDVVVMAGSSTPPWLFQPAPAGAGTKAVKFTITCRGPRAQCLYSFDRGWRLTCLCRHTPGDLDTILTNP
jgi:hypothetical protein